MRYSEAPDDSTRRMRKLWITLNVVGVLVFVSGAFFVNRFGMVLIGIGILIGIAAGIVQRIYFGKRMLDEE